MIKIIKATYGGKDCTEAVTSKIRGDSLILRSSNGIIGDPASGIVKYLEIEAEVDGKKITESIKEGSLLILPKSYKNKVGIFYSNNITPSINPAIQASLESIRVAAKDKVDIYTCMWKHEPKNPFTEYIAWTNTSSHLNQLLQIMQLLYSAREINNYEYVSFLEHDVLYAEGYFDYPEFTSGEVYTNMNYMGMNKEGYQPLIQRDKPFHEMTMRFEDAIRHCENILPNALIVNSGSIEAQDLKIKQWESSQPSIHINHGHHFTSHYNVYSKTNLFKKHPYWGSHSNWKYLFE